MRYKNTKTGIEMNFSCEISGGDWVPVDEIVDEAEEVIDEDAAEEPQEVIDEDAAKESQTVKKPGRKARK